MCDRSVNNQPPEQISSTAGNPSTPDISEWLVLTGIDAASAMTHFTSVSWKVFSLKALIVQPGAEAGGWSFHYEAA